jgi:hypothetical protein
VQGLRVVYEDWLADFNRRVSRHDDCVAALARHISARTGWRVRARGAPGFPAPYGSEVDVECHRDDLPPLCIEVEVLEALVRRETLRRLGLLAGAGTDARVVIVADEDAHERDIGDACRLLGRAGLRRIQVAAIAPDSAAITGADW